jgi:drug/metabolite transporter (DMT)-like permease
VVIAFWRVAFAAGAFLVFLALTRRLGEIHRHSRRTLLRLVGLGIGLAAIWLLFFTALGQARVAVVVVLSFTWPLFAALLAPSLAGDPFHRGILLPLGIAMAGAALIAFAGSRGEGEAQGSELLGAALALAVAFLIGSTTSLQRRLLHESRPSPEFTMFVETATATVVLLPGALLLPGPSSWQEWSALATLGLGMTTVPFLLYLRGLYRSRADQVGVVALAEPVMAALLASLVLSEPLTPALVVGGGAVLVGGLLVLRLRPPETGGNRLEPSNPQPGRTART